MMRTRTTTLLRRRLGAAILSPLTALVLLLYVMPLSLLGWIRYVGWREADLDGPSRLGAAWCWLIDEGELPWWMLERWLNRSGRCLGSVVILNLDPDGSKRGRTALLHELHHVHQMHRLGPVAVVLYLACRLSTRILGESEHSNPFEIAAKRATSQIVDGQSFIQGFVAARGKDDA